MENYFGNLPHGSIYGKDDTHDDTSIHLQAKLYLTNGDQDVGTLKNDAIVLNLLKPLLAWRASKEFDPVFFGYEVRVECRPRNLMC